MKQEGEGGKEREESKSGGEVGDGGGKGEGGGGGSGSGFLRWLRENLQGMLCQTFQRFALEGEESIRDLVHQVGLRKEQWVILFPGLRQISSSSLSSLAVK